ncbi:MAG: RNA-binding S4 domain-containing protein [Pseudomonadota bacterium]
MSDDPARQRIDKWLWYARFFKTRSLAAKMVTAGHIRVNGERVTKPAQTVGPDDMLTFATGRNIRVIQVVSLLSRRGPAAEAQTAYLDQSPAPSGPPPARVGARPTGRDRRKLDQLRDPPEEG